MSSPNADAPMTPMSEDIRRYYTDMLVIHTDDSRTGVCRVCHVHRCEDWRFAHERLIADGIDPSRVNHEA